MRAFDRRSTLGMPIPGDRAMSRANDHSRRV
jgi:hypothetical protein